MKIIILASGKGTRLGFLTNNTPKPLVDLGDGKTILETQIENIKNSGVIDEIVVIVGYCGEQIEAKLKKYQNEGMKIKILYNPLYDFSNNLITLWLAKNEMDNDFIITNGDNIFDKEVFFDLVTKNKEGIFLTTVKREKYYEDDMKVIIRQFGIEKVSKTLPLETSNAESVGLTLISGERSIKIFKETLEELARDTNNLNKFWLETFNKIADRGGIITPFEIDSSKWQEIDIHLDLKEVLDLIQKKRAEKLGF